MEEMEKEWSKMSDKYYELLLEVKDKIENKLSGLEYIYFKESFAASFFDPGKGIVEIPLESIRYDCDVDEYIAFSSKNWEDYGIRSYGTLHGCIEILRRIEEGNYDVRHIG